MSVSRLTLSDFRSYENVTPEPGPGFVLLYGENGAGKTNLLEALSMLTPGRGLRGAALPEMARQDSTGSWAVAAKLGQSEIGTGVLPHGVGTKASADQRAPAAVNSLSEWLSVLWLTPAMDRLFAGSTGERRRFLDRLVLALEPRHAYFASRYEAAMRARNKLLAEERWDEDWLASLEAAMAEHGSEIAAARARTAFALDQKIAEAPDDDFARAAIHLEGWREDDLEAMLKANRSRDARAGRATHGPHRQDLAVLHRAKQVPASRSSTGEQKALLLGLVLAHADLVTERRGEPPILLLDEVAAHLDPRRRRSLFDRLYGRGQVWMTATEAALFDGIGAASRFHVQPGQITSV